MLRVDIEKMPSFNIGLERGMQKGLEKGIEKGVEKGKLEAKKAIAKSMLINNIPIDIIIKVTQLTKEEIENL